MPVYPYMNDEQRKVARDAYVSWKGSRYSVPWQYAGRKSGCATTDQRLRSTAAPGASAIHEERKQERFDNRSCCETSVVEMGNRIAPDHHSGPTRNPLDTALATFGSIKVS
jgi:hypothetical protein